MPFKTAWFCWFFDHHLTSNFALLSFSRSNKIEQTDVDLKVMWFLWTWG